VEHPTTDLDQAGNVCSRLVEGCWDGTTHPRDQSPEASCLRVNLTTQAPDAIDDIGGMVSDIVKSIAGSRGAPSLRDREPGGGVVVQVEEDPAEHDRRPRGKPGKRRRGR
jgi:hypothetical protein